MGRSGGWVLGFGVMIAAPAGVGETPVLVVDEARLRSNIGRMAAQVNGAGRALRPHFKTSKMLPVARLQLEAGAVGFCCATRAELEVLAEAGVSDLLWAHQPVGEAKVRAVMDLNRRAQVMVALDSPEAAAPVSRAAVAAGITVPFLLEVDTGLGRAGAPPESAVARARLIADLPGLEIAGVMTHEGHVSAHGADRSALEEAGRRAGRALAGVADKLRAAGTPVDIVSVGSTPAASSAPFADGVTEARPGTYVFYDANQVFYGSAEWEDCALTVAARVVSRPRPETAVIDAGQKAMSSDPSQAGQGYGALPGRDIRFDRAYEEHGVLTGPGAEELQVGDLVSIIPNHACQTVNMWSGAAVVRDGAVADRWDIVARY